MGSAIALATTRLASLGNRDENGERSEFVVSVLATATFGCLLIADASLMSKAEVERIWLPFIPWVLLGCALLPTRWVRPALAVQVVTALLVQHLLFTGW